MTYYHGTSDIFEWGLIFFLPHARIICEKAGEKKIWMQYFLLFPTSQLICMLKKRQKSMERALVVYRVIPLGNVHYRGGVEYGSNIAVIVTKE